MSRHATGADVIETGQLIAGHYRLVEHIGSGAMGVVWRAVDERLERSVAVKKIVGQNGVSDADRADLHRRAMREAKIAAKLQHPHAIVVFDITEHEGSPCLVMEYLRSRSLSEILAQRGTIGVAEACRIGEQVASALVAAHEAGIVHRDVKPGNILIDETGVAKLTDFGISRAHGDMTLTATGLVGGTPAYLSPDLARGADPSPSSDVFALGATLYHAIEGQSPYGSNPNQLALLHTAASGKVTPPSKAGPATALLMAMLRVEPAERVSMKQASERLAAVASGGGVPAPPAPLLPARPPGPLERTAVSPRTTATFDAVETSHQPPPSAAAPVSRQRGDTEQRKKNLVLLGGLALFLAVMVAAAFALFGPDDDDGTAAPPPDSAATQPGDNPDGQGSDDDGDDGDDDAAETVDSDAPVEWGPAGRLVIDYYTFPAGLDASWNLLTTNAQQQFGDKDSFQEHWSQFDSVYSRGASAYKRENNPDGSVDIEVTVVTIADGTERPQQKRLRVVNVDGALLIDSDTR